MRFRGSEKSDHPVCSTRDGVTMFTTPSACSVKLSPIASKEGGAAIVTGTGTISRTQITEKANMVLVGSGRPGAAVGA